MFQATIFFKYVGGLKLGFEATLSLDFWFQNKLFSKSFEKRQKFAVSFFFCLIGSTASKQTILANVQLLSMLAKKNEENV